jgi:hypothetical protein
MKITKVADTYDLYKAELSWSELNSIIDALEVDGTGAVTDELSAGFKWYMEKLPGPGEEEKEDGEDGEGELGAAEHGEPKPLDELPEAPSAEKPPRAPREPVEEPAPEGGRGPGGPGPVLDLDQELPAAPAGPHELP